MCTPRPPIAMAFPVKVYLHPVKRCILRVYFHQLTLKLSYFFLVLLSPTFFLRQSLTAAWLASPYSHPPASSPECWDYRWNQAFPSPQEIPSQPILASPSKSVTFLVGFDDSGMPWKCSHCGWPSHICLGVFEIWPHTQMPILSRSGIPLCDTV